jgi:hypothetical protein
VSFEQDLRVLDHKLRQLKLDYERYFLGNRPREPVMLLSEVQKLIVIYSNQAIQNTGLRFKFNSLCSRFQAHKRQWNETLRKIEQGTYSRHRFKAKLHDRERLAADPPAASAGRPLDDPELFAAYVEARRACGQDVQSLTPDKLRAILSKQEDSPLNRYDERELRFQVVVEDGKARLKASPVRD